MIHPHVRILWSPWTLWSHLRSLHVTTDVNQKPFLSHTAHLTCSCQFLFYNIRMICSFLFTQASQVLVWSFLILRLDYHNSTLSDLTLCTVWSLQLIQNAAAQLVYNLSKFSHTTPLIYSLHCLPVVSRIEFKTIAYRSLDEVIQGQKQVSTQFTSKHLSHFALYHAPTNSLARSTGFTISTYKEGIHYNSFSVVASRW